jgi:NAD(P)-dependent dehydrogenase (short-subunit alcohol dehydrogenase family)
VFANKNCEGEARMAQDNAQGSRIAIITGGSRGLGRNTAIAAARHGIGSIITYNASQAEADKTVKEIEAAGEKAVALKLDTSTTAGFDAFAGEVRRVLKETWGRDSFDYLVNNAGTSAPGTIMDMKEDDFDHLYAIHLKGVFFLTQKLLPIMRDGGRIVNISSGLARFATPGFSAYGSLKGAIDVLSRYMAKELGPRGIAVNAVAPGAIETDFGNGRVRDNPELNKMVASITALGRVGLPDDIGPMIAALLGDENRWMTGQRLEVSGGMYL